MTFPEIRESTLPAAGPACRLAGWAIERHPQYSIAAFCRSFPHKDEVIREPFVSALERAGIPRD